MKVGDIIRLKGDHRRMKFFMEPNEESEIFFLNADNAIGEVIAVDQGLTMWVWFPALNAYAYTNQGFDVNYTWFTKISRDKT